jgi:hypothetical protein
MLRVIRRKQHCLNARRCEAKQHQSFGNIIDASEIDLNEPSSAETRFMSDIFISYASEDRARVEPLAEALEAQGWSVWWDRIIPAGKDFEQVIEEAIDGARCVVVVWSEKSVTSRWVRTEADEGANRQALVPVLIDEVKIPLAFRRIQAANLVGWRRSAPHVGFDQLVRDIAGLLGTASTPASAPGFSTTEPRSRPDKPPTKAFVPREARKKIVVMQIVIPLILLGLWALVLALRLGDAYVYPLALLTFVFFIGLMIIRWLKKT